MKYLMLCLALGGCTTYNVSDSFNTVTNDMYQSKIETPTPRNPHNPYLK
jgi:hypothetical protein